MNLASVDSIVKAVLYEGYILYPYRSSNVKNQRRWTFGGVYPREYARREQSCDCSVQTECLLRGDKNSVVDIHVRFLQLVSREVGEFASPVCDSPPSFDRSYAKVPSLKVGDEIFQSWEEAIERDVAAPSLTLKQLSDAPVKAPFAFAGQRSLTPLKDAAGAMRGMLVRASADLEGDLTIAAQAAAPGVFRLSVRINNLTQLGPDEGEEAARRGAFASTHTILGVRGGAFLSMIDPPPELTDAAAACDNHGAWPVLAGAEGAADMMLSSPIILYDYPQVAPESPGDLFDAAEIDEILTLRILAMTDQEKRDMAGLDARARALLERTESLTAADMAKLHGARRQMRASADAPLSAVAQGEPLVRKPELAFLQTGGHGLAVGDRVRLRPKGGADIFDLLLKDEMAVIEAIECDFDNRVHVAVVLESDPGREFGLERMPGHRFFFSPDELEPAA